MEAREIIKEPVVTEKATDLRSKDNKYVFVVDKRATKAQIKQAVEKIYNVKVLEVRTANRKGKTRRSGYKWGTTSHWKKAVVVLHADHHIDLF